MALPVVVFDTSALSFLIKDGQRSEPYLKALTCGFDVWLTAMSVDEIIATPVPDTREMLTAGLQRLLTSGRCVWPPHEVVTILASTHANNPTTFNWREVNIGETGYERAIIDRDFTDQLCETQLQQQRNLEDGFMRFWQSLRMTLNPFLDADPTKRPTCYSQAAEIARSAKPSLLLGIGVELYKRGAKRGAKIEKTPSDAEIEALMEICPPFQAICYGVLGSWFDISMAPQVFKRLAGRNDQMMAVYLPYCSRFVTADRKQETRLREIAVEAKLVDCEVLSYADFLTSLRF
jgi:hypothetical protein